MVLLKRTLISLGLAALLLVPGIVSVSEMASADEAENTTPVVTPAEDIPLADTRTVDPTDAPDGDGDVPESSDTSTNTPQEGDDSQAATTDECVSSSSEKVVTIDGKTYVEESGKVVCPDTAQSFSTLTPYEPAPAPSVEGTTAKESSVPASLQAKPNAVNTRTSPANTRTAPASTATRNVVNTARNNVRSNASALAPASAVESVDETVTPENSDAEAPKLPVTGMKKTVKSSDGEEAAGAAVVADSELTLVSSRAGLVALVACAGFAIVAAGSVVTMRNFKR